MPVLRRLKQEFSFIRGNYAVLVVSWILLDFASEIPAAYYAPVSYTHLTLPTNREV